MRYGGRVHRRPERRRSEMLNVLELTQENALIDHLMPELQQATGPKIRRSKVSSTIGRRA